MLILTEKTPNPDALKFVPPRRLTPGRSHAFRRVTFEEASSDLAARVFQAGGVTEVFIAPEFLTVTRAQNALAWPDLKPLILAAIADHLEAGVPAVPPYASEVGEAPEEDEIEAEIRTVLGLYIRPGVARDGGEVLLDRFDPATGVLWIRMHGACGGCPSAGRTLKSTVEKTVRRYVPEVLRVEESAPLARDVVAPTPQERLASGLEERGSVARTVFTYSGRVVDAAGEEAPSKGDPDS